MFLCAVIRSYQSFFELTLNYRPIIQSGPKSKTVTKFSSTASNMDRSDFRNSITETLSSKVAIKKSLKILPHFRPFVCEIFMSLFEFYILLDNVAKRLMVPGEIFSDHFIVNLLLSVPVKDIASQKSENRHF